MGKSDGRNKLARKTDLEPLVLQDLLDGNIVTGFCLRDELCLEDDTEGAVSDDFAVCIGNVHCVARLSFGGDDFDDLPGVVDGCTMRGEREGRHGEDGSTRLSHLDTSGENNESPNKGIRGRKTGGRAGAGRRIRQEVGRENERQTAVEKR